MNNRDRLLQIPIIADIMSTWPGATMSVLSEPTEVEINGMISAGDAAGIYLDSIGKSDLSEMTYEEYMTLIETIIKAFQLHCAKIFESEIPY